MPRRPRLVHRAPSQNASSNLNHSKSSSEQSVQKLPKRRLPSFAEDSYDAGNVNELDEESEEDSSRPSDSEFQGISANEGDDDDADAPRVAQWVDDEEVELEDDEDGVGEVDGVPGSSQLVTKNLQSNLSGLPLGALRRAQHVLSRAEALSDSEEESDVETESNDKPEGAGSKGKDKEVAKSEWSIKPRPDISKRSNKHAPMEVTSKRPVTRRRTVVEVKKVQARDPRFLPVAGEFSAEIFQKQYNFLADSHKTELRTLRENLKRARKLLDSSPRDLREEREQEVARLEFAVKRAESLVNKDRLDKVEREALTRVTKGEKEKRKQGKGGWWLKETDKRELLMKARYDALAAEGGKRAVKKAIDKKQKKVNQKEKKARPFPRGGSQKRAFDSGGEGHGASKRRRVG